MDIKTVQETYNQDGVLLRKASLEHKDEFNTTGCLYILECPDKRYEIEWRPNEFLISSTDTQEQDEWSFVDTIAKRNRTTSECLIFDTATNNISLKSDTANNGSRTTSSGGVTSPVATAAAPKRNRNIRVALTDLKLVEVQRNGQVVRLISKEDRVHSEFLFQHGNADNLIRTLRGFFLIVRASSDKMRTIYEVTAEKDLQEKMQKTFAELEIGDIKSPTGWISNMVQRPMDMLAKIANNYNIHGNTTGTLSPRSSSPTSSTSSSSPPPSSNNNNHNTPTAPTSVTMFQSTSGGDDYELLSTSPKVRTNNNNNNSLSTVTEEPKHQSKKPKLPERILRPRGLPLTRSQWNLCFSEDGSVSESMVESVKKKIFEGGLEDEIRVDVWKFLLDYERWEDTTRQRELRRAQKNSEYYIMKSQWLRMSTVQEDNFSDYRDRKCQIQKDVKRTDRTQEFFAGDDNPNLEALYEILMTFVMYNFDLGYVQGMSDLLAPLLCVMRNERDAFWCFVGFMQKVMHNFDIDQAGMKEQLLNLNKLLSFVNPGLAQHLSATGSDNMFFCFRWLLVWFKREFSHEDIMRLWEVLWTSRPCANYHLLVSVAVLDSQAEVIMGRNYEFTEVLKHVNELSGQLQLDRILADAEAIYYQVINAGHLTDEVRGVLGMERVGGGNGAGENREGGSGGSGLNDEEDVLDQMKVASPVKSFEDEDRMQRKIEEALEQSMYFGFY